LLSAPRRQSKPPLGTDDPTRSDAIEGQHSFDVSLVKSKTQTTDCRGRSGDSH
jgi:hypothetical protein